MIPPEALEKALGTIDNAHQKVTAHKASSNNGHHELRNIVVGALSGISELPVAFEVSEERVRFEGDRQRDGSNQDGEGGHLVYDSGNLFRIVKIGDITNDTNGAPQAVITKGLVPKEMWHEHAETVLFRARSILQKQG